MLKISEIKMHIDEDIATLKVKISKKLRIDLNSITNFNIVKESIDARIKNEIYFVYTVEFDTNDNNLVLKNNKHNKRLIESKKKVYHLPEKGDVKLSTRPVVIGFGPAGMYNALILAEAGYNPIVFERGEDVDNRLNSVNKFWNKNILNEESNVQFGEGGAGTFSDGKLTARTKHVSSVKVLEMLVKFGAPKEVLYEAHPHIGTDLLRGIVKRLREYIISLGAEVNFNSKLTDIIINDNQITAVEINNKSVIETSICVLAIGHSARDTFFKLNDLNVTMENKSFAVGLRVEHKKELINKAQYKEFANHPKVGTAEYRLTHKASTGKGVYTFCMCPGGLVVGSTSIAGRVVTNGMSLHARDEDNSNSAVIVQVDEKDYGNELLDGIKYQDELEKKAFELGGSNYKAPFQTVKNYINSESDNCKVHPSFSNGVSESNLSELFSDIINNTLKEGLKAFDRKIPGFSGSDAVLTGVESRTSSPIKILRKVEDFESVNINGLYPCGEGAGYAGGIVSSAMDGIKVAEAIIKKYTI